MNKQEMGFLGNLDDTDESGRAACTPQEAMLDFMTVVVSIIQVMYICQLK